MATAQVNQVLTALELEHLAEVREVTNTTNTAGWQRIIKQIQAFVEEAHEDIFLNASADPRHAQLLVQRWQQREAVYRGILHYVKSCESAKEELLLQAKERSGVPTPDYAESDRENY